MFERLKRLFDAGNLTLTGLKNAVTRAWITASEYKEISGEEFAA